ncbi:TorF family putative porin [Kordiimonas pumila]|uniref:TorF family putative porin n=1 Tax=Kordiimonas pumila TaxID=2161677 RepID=A0ABV7D758_9PROT|nr:TorF family putative porin [Kordiimonas pumila]
MIFRRGNSTQQQQAQCRHSVPYLCVVVPLLALPFGTATYAADNSFEIDGYVGVTSDYRDRGISMSDLDASVRGSISVFHDSGFYGGVDAALIDDQMGGDTKTEFFAGYSMDQGDYIYDFSAELDGIHGNGSDYYPEFKASMARDFGLAFIRTGLAYAPEGRWNTPDVDSLYAYTDLEIPVPTFPELTIISRLGYDMRSDRSNLLDWSAGLSVFVDSFEVTLIYEDSSLDSEIAKGRFVFGTRFYF